MGFYIRLVVAMALGAAAGTWEVLAMLFIAWCCGYFMGAEVRQERVTQSRGPS